MRKHRFRNALLASPATLAEEKTAQLHHSGRKKRCASASMDKRGILRK